MATCVWMLPLSVAVIVIVYKLCDWLIRLPMIADVQRRYILITGCDSGFGYEAARKLDAIGCHVFAGCLTESGETKLRKSCSGRLRTVALNVTSAQSIQNAYRLIVGALPTGVGLWGVVNNAGILGNFGPSDWLERADYEKTLAVNLYGLIDVTMTFLPLVKKAQGRIVNTASIVARMRLPGSNPYVVSKCAVEAFSDVLRVEMSHFGVSVHQIEPGFHKTNLLNQQTMEAKLRAMWSRTSAAIKEAYGAEYLEHAIKATVHNFIDKVAATSLDGVVDAYAHALLGTFPRARYVIGRDSLLLFLPMSRLPEWLSDRVVHAMRRFSRGPKPATSLLA